MAAKITDYAQYFRDKSKVNERGCWIWQGGFFASGYGYMKYKMQPGKLAHRISYETFKGPIPVGLVVRHNCDTPACVNPDHLIAGTHARNSADMIERGRSANGELCARSKLTEDQVREIRAMYPTSSLGVIAEKFGITFANAGYICRRETWKHVK